MPPKPVRIKTRTLPPRELAKLVAISRLSGVKVIDWQILGQPAPDSIRGSLHVRPSSVGRIVGELAKLRATRPIVEVFPLGIPNPKLFNVRFRG